MAINTGTYCSRCGEPVKGSWYRLVIMNQKPTIEDGCKISERHYREDYVVCPSCRVVIEGVLNFRGSDE